MEVKLCENAVIMFLFFSAITYIYGILYVIIIRKYYTRNQWKKIHNRRMIKSYALKLEITITRCFSSLPPWLAFQSGFLGGYQTRKTFNISFCVFYTPSYCQTP